MPNVLTDTGRRVGGHIISEATGADGAYRSRETVTIAAGALIVPGQVLARRKLGAATSAAKSGGNTGTGTLTVDNTAPVKHYAKAGVYKLRFTTATVFSITGPDGVSIGSYAIGGSNGNSVTVDNVLKFVVTQAATVFVIGDGFDITVAAGDGAYLPLDESGVAGLNVPAAVSYGEYDATSAAVTGVVNVRETTLNGHELVWPNTYNDADIAAAVAILADLGLVVRY